jgi:hypothetical protein
MQKDFDFKENIFSEEHISQSFELENRKHCFDLEEGLSFSICKDNILWDCEE